MVGTVPVSDPPTYVAVGNVTAEGDGLGKVSRIFSFAVYPTGIEAFTNEESAPNDVYDGSEITEIRIQHSGGVKTVTSAQWSGSAGTGFIYLWYPDTDVIWDATDQGLTYYVEIDTNAPPATTPWDNIDIVTEDFVTADARGGVSVNLTGVTAGDFLLVSSACASPAAVKHRISDIGTNGTINGLPDGSWNTLGMRSMGADGYDTHQWSWAKVPDDYSGDGAITINHIAVKKFGILTLFRDFLSNKDHQIRVWRLSGVYNDDPILDRRAVVDTAKENPQPSEGLNPVMRFERDRKYAYVQAAPSLDQIHGVFYSVIIDGNTGGNGIPDGVSQWHEEDVGDYNGANEDPVEVLSKSYVGGDNYFNFNDEDNSVRFTMADGQKYMIDVIALRSANWVAEQDTVRESDVVRGDGRSGVALPAVPRTASTTAVIQGGRTTGRG